MCSVLSVHFYLALYRYSRSQGHTSDPWEPDTPTLSKILISLSHNTIATALLLPSLRVQWGAEGAREVWERGEIFFSPPMNLMTVPAGLVVGKKASCQLHLSPGGEHICVGGRFRLPVKSNRQKHSFINSQTTLADTNNTQNCFLEKYQHKTIILTPKNNERKKKEAHSI